MVLTSRAAKFCCIGGNKRPRSARADSSSDKPVKFPRQASTYRPRAAPGLTTFEPEGVPVPRWSATDSKGHRESNT